MITVGLDVECSKLPNVYPWMPDSFLVSVGLAWEDGTRRTWTFNHKEDELFMQCQGHRVYFSNQREMIYDIQRWIYSSDRIVGHNLKFDLNWLRALEIDFDHCKLWCTLVTEYLLVGQRIGQLSLDDLSKKYLSINKMDMVKTFWNSGYETNEVPLRVLLPYLEQDCINALAIYQKQVPLVKREGMGTLLTIQNENTRVLSEIEHNGMALDVDVAERHYQNLKLQLARIDAELLLLFNFDCNFDSKHEVSAGLYGGKVKREREEEYVFTYKSKPESVLKTRKYMEVIEVPGLGFPKDKRLETKNRGVYQTNKNTIKFLKCQTKEQREAKKLLLERSVASKALETLRGKDNSKGIINKVVDGIIHPKYNQTIAKTGRLSSSDPNGQNMPRSGTSPVKESVIARFDYILGVDLKQVEWRVAAFLSQDPVMIKEILNGVDPHYENAIHVFGGNPNDGKKFDEIRTVAKIVTFRLLYGGTAMGFYYDNKMPNFSKKRWEEIVDAFWDKYQGLAQWQANNMRTVIQNDGVLRTITGRKFIFHRDEWKGEYKPAQIKNFPVQGMATADIMPLAMVIIHKKYRALKAKGYKSLIIGQVHDSLIFDCTKNELKVIAKMCIEVMDRLPEYIERLWGFKFNVPLGGDAEYGPSWGKQEKLKLAA